MNSLVEAEGSAAEEKSVTQGKYNTLDVVVEGGIYKIKLNRPNKKNAITIEVGLQWNSVPP